MNERVAVVLSGAGARGAFQAGALAEIVPALTARGERPTIWLGTSAGSINAVLGGATAHLDPEEAAATVTALWQRMSDDDVYRPLLPFGAPRVAAEYAAGALLGLGPGTRSLLDTGPLARTAARELPTHGLAANIADGLVTATGVVATRTPAASGGTPPGGSGRSVLFLAEHARSGYAGDPDRALDVVRGPVLREHVLASSAIPVAFPPVRVDAPAEAAGWYVDGGVRLNTPLHPAVHLGATKVVVVSATATTVPPPPGPDLSASSPDVADAAAQVLTAVMGDRTAEDLLALRRTNRMIRQAREAGAAGLLEDASGRPYRQVEVMAVSPAPGAMGEIAGDVHRRRTQGTGRLAELDNWLLGKALRGAGDGVGRRELLSYLLFDEVYFTEGVALGRAAAREVLATGWSR